MSTQLANAFMSNLLDLGLQGKGLPVDSRFIQDLLEQIGGASIVPAPYRSPFGTLFSTGDDERGAGYFLSEDKSLLFILVEPPSRARAASPATGGIEGVRGAIAALTASFPGCRSG